MKTFGTRILCCGLTLASFALVSTFDRACADSRGTPLPSRPGNSSATASPSISSLAQFLSVAGREPAPLRLRTLEGQSVSIQDLKGEVVLLNFWATWCKPCVAEMPVLAKLAERYGKRGLHVIAASVDENATHEELEQFADRLPKGMDVWTGVTMSDMQRMDVQALPTTVIIDREGSLVRVHHGQLGEGYLDPVLDELLGGKSQPSPQPDKPRHFDSSEA